MAQAQEPESYAAAQDELRGLLDALQGEDVDLDAMTVRVERARELIAWSRERLRTTQLAVDDLLAETDRASDE